MKGTCLGCRRTLGWEFDPDRQVCDKCQRSLAADNTLSFDELARRRQKRRADQESARKAYHLKQYGLTVEDYERMIAEQGEVCAICHQPFDRPLFVDHCHTHGHVRGLLCGPCNSAIGQMGDDPERLRSAADYLERTKAPVPPPGITAQV